MEISVQERLFFAKRPGALAVYARLREALEDKACVTVTVHKTQISLVANRLFACVWHPPVKRYGESALLVSVALPYALESPRLFGLARTGASRCTCHVAVAGEGQVDRELLGWVEEAYQYSLRP